MSFKAVLLLCALAAPMVAQADPQPIPAAKRAYIGDWKGKDMELNIEAGGKLHYKRNQPGKNLDLNVDIIGFNDASEFNEVVLVRRRHHPQHLRRHPAAASARQKDENDRGWRGVDQGGLRPRSALPWTLRIVSGAAFCV